MANSYIEYTANGSTTTFSIPFAYTRQADVTVFVGGTSTSFTFASSSTISLSTAPTSGTIVRINRTTVITTRAVDFTNGAILTEADLDNSNIQVFQAAQEAIDTAEASISKAADGKFDAQSRVIKNVANPVNAQDAATKNWSETASTSQVNIATTKASEASSSATASANSATAASSSASGASNSATAAANSATAGAASASTAATKASLATTNGAAQVALATTQAGLATTNGAAQVALATTQAGLATTNGAAQVVLATAQKTIAVTKASESAASATASANSATASANSATASGNSATAAASSASTATTKRNESSASATAAANSAAAAATALDSFDDRYLGAKSSAPNQDNDGNALVQGALYFDTSANGMKVYDGSAWIAASSSGTASLLTYKYIATNNQTTFTGSDANSVTLTYTATNILVLLNGITLDASDYTATNGSSIVLGAGATTGSELVVVAFKSFTVADHYTKSQANALLAAKAALASPAFTGNVGINNSSPTQRLEINGNAQFNMYDNTGGNGGYYTTKGLQIGNAFDAGESGGGDDRNAIVWNERGTNLLFGTNDLERMRITYDGNLGLGVIPATWHSNYDVLQMGEQTMLYAHADGIGNDSATYLGTNVYENNGAKYLRTDKSSLYRQQSGKHSFYVAPSGTADSAISWTTGLEVLNDGRARAKNGLLFGTDTATASTLSDYETGSWTPTIAQVGTFSVPSAIYTKVGNVVTVQAYLEMGVNTGSGSQAVIGGLPFTCKTNAYATGLVDMSASNTTVTNPHVRVGSGTTNAYVYKNNNNSLSGAEIDAAHFIFSVTYHAVS